LTAYSAALLDSGSALTGVILQMIVMQAKANNPFAKEAKGLVWRLILTAGTLN